MVKKKDEKARTVFIWLRQDSTFYAICKETSKRYTFSDGL
jgi:hypothetical protein